MAITYLETLTGYTVVDKPLTWHLAGRTQTASGYSKKLASPICVKTDDGKVRRVYVTCYSNAGTAWVRYNNQSRVVLRTSVLYPGDRVERDATAEGL